jgi:hypothetical protein
VAGSGRRQKDDPFQNLALARFKEALFIAFPSTLRMLENGPNPPIRPGPKWVS